MDSANPRTVAIVEAVASYPKQQPFHPDTRYPESPRGQPLSAENRVYSAVRELLATLGLDRERYGASDWNPLGSLINPGDTVVVKPNLIREARLSDSAQWQQVITHGSVIRAVVDYVALALQGRGKILILDGPQTDSSFDLVVQRSGLEGICEHVRNLGVDCALMDLRRERWVSRGEVTAERIELPGDPEGYVEVPMDGCSEFIGYSLSGEFYGADYDMAETASYHRDGRHRYVMCRSVMAADVIINIPKLKTHKKTGVTLNLKNMVGVNGLRNCLPHFTSGSPEDGGDEFLPGVRGARLQSGAIRMFKRALARRGGHGGSVARLTKRVGALVFGRTDVRVRSGNWYGNDTAWRMVLDVNKALVGFDAQGVPRNVPLPIFCLVDGIVGGDGDGPSDPDPRECGILVGGLSPVAVDTVASILMGFDDRRLPVVSRAWNARGVSLVGFVPEEVKCVSNRSEWCGSLATLREARHFGFRPYFGWQGHVERDRA